MTHVALFSPFVRGPINFPETPLADFLHPVGHAWHVHMSRKSSRVTCGPKRYATLKHSDYYFNTSQQEPYNRPPAQQAPPQQATAQHEQEQQVSPARAQTSPARARAQTAGGRTRGHTTGPGIRRFVGGGRGTRGHLTSEEVAALDLRQRRQAFKTRVRQGFRPARFETRKELWENRNRPGDENYIPVCANISANCVQVITIPVLW